MDFSLQLRAARLRLVYADDAVCHTEGPADTSGLRNQRTRWRYGAFACFARHRNLFLSPRSQSFALSFYELPFSLLGYLQILLYPLVFLVAFALPIYTGQYLYLAMLLLSVPVNFAIVFYTRGTLREHARYLPILIVLTSATMIIENVTMWSALRRYAMGAHLPWTTWERQGVHGPAMTAWPSVVPSVVIPSVVVPSVVIPPAIVRSLTSGFPTSAELEARMDAELAEILDGRSAADVVGPNAFEPGATVAPT
jgi:cellulose synthase/poly-beta-1,6-N-acetylglucosamine synthase-like glycosyltransferase